MQPYSTPFGRDSYRLIIIPLLPIHLLLSSFTQCLQRSNFLSLCDNPILIKDAKMSFSLEQLSGKKCYMISARDLKITWGDTPDYWIWNSDENSRFGESAELLGVCWLETRGKINTCMLSTRIVYSIYLVFKLRHGAYGWKYRPIQAAVELVDSINENREQSFYLDRKNGSSTDS